MEEKIHKLSSERQNYEEKMKNLMKRLKGARIKK